jgi:hypothetical protein
MANCRCGSDSVAQNDIETEEQEMKFLTKLLAPFRPTPATQRQTVYCGYCGMPSDTGAAHIECVATAEAGGWPLDDMATYGHNILSLPARNQRGVASM